LGPAQTLEEGAVVLVVDEDGPAVIAAIDRVINQAVVDRSE